MHLQGELSGAIFKYTFNKNASNNLQAKKRTGRPASPPSYAVERRAAPSANNKQLQQIPPVIKTQMIPSGGGLGSFRGRL